MEHLTGELHKSEVLLIASTLLVVKAENILEHKENAHNNGNRALPLNSF